MFHIHWYSKQLSALLIYNVENRGRTYKYVTVACRCGKEKGKYFPFMKNQVTVTTQESS